MFELGRSFTLSVERNPDATAIVDEDLRLSYRDWYGRILAVAGGLEALGLKQGDHLVSAMQNRWEAATYHWACQFLGVVMTPVNWRMKGPELEFVIENAGARAVAFEEITAEAVAEAPGAASLPRISRINDGTGTTSFEELLKADPIDGVPRAGVEDTSLMLYTSGTTGNPKGVPRSHRAERAAAIAHVAQHRCVYGERILGIMPFYHTMGVRSLLAVQLVDGCIICQQKFDAARALALIASENVTSLFLVPTLFHDVMAAPEFAGADVSSVKRIGFAGASMTDGLLKKIDEAFRPELFVNHYGSSEIYSFSIEPNAPAKPGSAGKAGINQRIRVVKLGSTDPEEAAPVGEEGQIIADMAGDEAFAGYWRRPDADEKALHGGWYFTGDTGFVDGDGDLFVTGRVDDMMISGGENVSPVEIESVLSLHASVGEVAVVGLPDERWGQKVTAFVARSSAVDADELDAHCMSSELADFKRPRAYVFVREIPKSPVGKILRRMLLAGDYETE